MIRNLAIASVLAPFLVPVAYGQSNGQSQGSQFQGDVSFELNDSVARGDGPFDFDSADHETIRYSRVPEAGQAPRYADRQTEFSISVRPAKPKFSLENGFGLNMFSQAQPALAVASGQLGKNRLIESVPDIHEGFAYSAGVKVEHEDADIDGTAYVSSGLLGLSYGRLGRLWYGGVDLNVEQFVSEYDGAEQHEVLSVDFTTGRRLGWTGTTSASPLWMLSVHGNLDLQDDANLEDRSDWYLNPSLFWQNPGFTFSAQVQVPVDAVSSDSAVEPDYRLRAIFEKQF